MLLFYIGCNLYQINFNKKENGITHSKRRMLLFDVGYNLYQINFNKKEKGPQKMWVILLKAFTSDSTIFLDKFI
jgi:hypothetical protein